MKEYIAPLYNKEEIDTKDVIAKSNYEMISDGEGGADVIVDIGSLIG